MELVSAVIITHNRKDLVMRAIESVLTQTYTNIECIVVDDASTDGTVELLSSSEDINYIYIPKSESRGGNHARNVGIAASHGVYVAFLDDDDYWLPTKIEKQLEQKKKKKCGVVYCDNRPDKTFPEKISVTTADHDINYVMLKRNEFFLNNLRYYFEHGCFRFKDLRCKEAVLKALSY